MVKKYIKIKNLSVSLELANFINKDLLSNISISKKRFWSGFTAINRNLCVKRLLSWKCFYLAVKWLKYSYEFVVVNQRLSFLYIHKQRKIPSTAKIPTIIRDFNK